MAMGVQEEKEIADTKVHIRGNVHNLGEPVSRGFLQVAMNGSTPAFSHSESGRRELGLWLGSSQNPLTARVFANRAWHWLFGSGLVRTTDNFGTTGETPSHPELLDALAVRFIEDGWSIKSLVRRIVQSRVYQLSSESSRTMYKVDPENRLFGRANRRRLDAECLRDTILSASGQLRLQMGGPDFARNVATDYGYSQESARRSVYLPVFRNALPDLFLVFDLADPSLVTGSRNVSTVAPQALFFMNHPFVRRQAQQAAARLLTQTGPDFSTRLAWAYRHTLGRLPTEAESQVFLRYARDDTGSPEELWAEVLQALFGSVDFRYVK